MTKLKMAPIDSNLFKGAENLSADEILRLEISNRHEDVITVLRDYKWPGNNVIGCILLELSEDNKQVVHGGFQARGAFPQKEVRIKASTLWVSANPSVTLIIKLPGAEAFNFEDSLASDYLASDEVTHSFVAQEEGGPVAILAADREEYGVGPFCIRLVCHVVRATAKSGVVLKYTMMIFPGSRAGILDVSELAQSAGWPGLKVLDGELALCPMPQRAWQCPVLPLILTGTPLAEGETDLPLGATLRRAIAAIMSRSTPPEVCKSKTEVMNKWQKYANDPDKFSVKAGPLAWPAPQEAQPTPGTLEINS